LSAQAAINAAADADHITLISASMGRIFENTKYLDDESFVAFTKSLCRMSSEASGAPLADIDATTGAKNSKAVSGNGQSDVVVNWWFLILTVRVLMFQKLFNNKSFAIEKLRFIATLNMERLINPQTNFIAWDIIVNHLIITANYPFTPSAIRAQTCECISDIVISAMNVELSTNQDDHEKVQTRLLTALGQCIIDTVPQTNSAHLNSSKSSVFVTRTSSESQRMALETLNRLLQMSGHSLSNGWSLVFEMLTCIATGVNNLGDTNTDDSTLAVPESESPKLRRVSSDMMAAPGSKASMGLVRVAFSSLQLICTDFLSLLNPDSVRQCIATLGCFCTQKDDLNISLTAVGLLWNVSDFVLTKKQELEKSGSVEDTSRPLNKSDYSIERKIEGDATPRRLNNLWMLLLFQLSKVCVDSRPEVRNGANQTLFRTVGMNGNLLDTHTWHACIWEILFPLLDAVKLAAIEARKLEESQAATGTPDTDRDSVGFMMHHSRNTAEKQWDETKVLVLLGTSGIFHDFLDQLTELNDFADAWVLLLAHLEDSTLRSGAEVSLASIKSLKNITTLAKSDTESKRIDLWQKAWQTWERIGLGIATGEQTSPSDVGESLYGANIDTKSFTASLEESNRLSISNCFTQDTLITLVNTFTDLYPALKSEFGLQEIQRLLSVLRQMMIYSNSPQYRPDIDHLSPLQEAILDALCVIDMTVPGVAVVLNDLADYMSLAFLSPNHDNMIAQLANTTPIPPSQRKHSTVTYIALNKKCTKLVLDFFKRFSNQLELYQQGVFVKIIAALGIPMKLKYDCPPSFKHYDEDTPALWKSATTALLEVLDIGLPKVREFESGNCRGRDKTV
jgi:hypothetical protein